MNESRNIYLLWKVTFFVLCDSSVTVLDWKVLNGVLRFFVLFYIPIVHVRFIFNNKQLSYQVLQEWGMSNCQYFLLLAEGV